ncbi:hypothetical protein [Priestia megaterium]|uniref:hypothetical protein n=1 Tax=Priestia megaterium TaxID=1404 RepID=UPI00189F9EE4|nr:hypothetical protein [Priestia megaterium]
MKIFLGTPITPILNSENIFSIENKKNLSNLINSLRKIEGVDTVFCAIEREKWGEELLSGDVCTKLDYEEMIDTDIFIAIPNQSHGVHIEIGWASALKKKIIVLVNENFGIKTPLIEGLDKLTDTHIIRFKEDSDFPKPLTWDNEISPHLLKLLGTKTEPLLVK